MGDYRPTGDKTPPTQDEMRCALIASGRNYIPTGWKPEAPSPIKAAVVAEPVIQKPDIKRPLKPDQKV